MKKHMALINSLSIINLEKLSKFIEKIE